MSDSLLDTIKSTSIKGFHLLTHENISLDARSQCQLLALANDYLRRISNVKVSEQVKYFRAVRVAINETTLCRWRLMNDVVSGTHNYRISALCRFWGLSLEQMLEIGRQEKKRKESL